MDLLADLNEPQRQAVTHVDGPLLILAGVGSGKTRVVARRVAYLISQGIAPWGVLAITFTNKAAGEMRRRVEHLQVQRNATICTFHSLCARLLREFASEVNLSPNFTIYDRDDQVRLAKDVMGHLDLKTGNFSPSRIHGTISRAKNDLQSCEDFAKAAEDFYHRTVASIYRGYEEALAANNALDFDDLLLRMAFLLRDRPDIRELLSRRYQYILIDEYQDTNRAQYILAHGIAMDHENICATGDPDQSIYAWRGADIRNILEFEADYPNAKVIRLEENYRSVRPILDAASRLIAHNRMRKEKALWTRRQGGVDVRVVVCDSEHAEAEQLVRRIGEYRNRGLPYSDVAIFYRLNAQSRVMEQKLMEGGIPYRIARGVEFYNRKEIKDVLAYLRLLVNPADDLSCARIINTPARGIGATTLKRLGELATVRGLSLLEACRHASQATLSPTAAKRVERFCELIAELAGDLDRPVREITEDVVRKSGLAEALRAGETEDAYANVGELISTAAEFDATSDPDSSGLGDYLQRISLISDVDHMEGSSGAVTLMTLHAAKGLEFPVVFIIGCEGGLLPFERSDDQAWQREAPNHVQLEEERRLAFVGMTRAKDELTLSCARIRMIRGRRTPQTASMFLDEIGTEGVKWEDLTTPRSRPAARGGGFYADSEERAIIEAMDDGPSYPPEYEHLAEGCLVRHPQFGIGRVLKLTQRWPDTRATIDFERLGPKKIVLAKTHLELLWQA